MQFRELAARIANRDLEPLWLITGEEPLLMIEAADLLRSRARALGYEEREVLNASATWDWSQLRDACQAMSLFATKKIVELRLASPRPGTRGTEALVELAKMQGELQDVVVIVSLPYDWTIGKLAWFKTLQSASVCVQCDPIKSTELAQWFTERLRAQGQNANHAAIEILTTRCEGNLLAAKQELLKLAYRYPHEATITAEMVDESVGDVARFDAEALAEAIAKGEIEKAFRAVQSLRAEGFTIPSFLWILADDIRSAARTKTELENGADLPNALRTAAAFGPKAARVRQLVRRNSVPRLMTALCRVADIDRLSKGLYVSKRDSDPWNELLALVAMLCG